MKPLVRPWIGQLHHARELCDDWGCIRDEAGTMIIRVNLPTHDESVLNEHRRNKTDPTQGRVDAILAALNRPNPGICGGSPHNAAFAEKEKSR